MHIYMMSSGDVMLPKEKRFGAIEPYVYGLSKELSRENIVDVFAYGEGEEKTNNLHIRTFTLKPAIRNLRSIFVANLGYLNLQTMLCNAYLLRDIFKAHKTNQIDILHMHNTIPAPIMDICRFALNTPSVCSVHSYYRPRRLLQLFDKLLPVSEYMKNYLCKEKAISPSKIDVLPIAIDPDEWKPKLESEKAKINLGLQQYKIVLFVGRKCPEKGPQVLIEALPSIIQQNPRTLAIFIGSDYIHFSTYTSYTKFLVDKATRLKIEKNAIFKTWVPEDVMKQYYEAADVFVVPSVWQEPFGKVVIEAMACEKPVVATNAGGIPEIISHGKDGLLVPPNDPDALAEGILLILSDTELTKSLGRAGRETVNKRFSFEVIAERCLKIYSGLRGSPA